MRNMMVALLLLSRRRIGYERQSSLRAIDVVLHRGRSAHPDRPDNFSVHLNGKCRATSRCARAQKERNNKGGYAFSSKGLFRPHE
jgi:hypothetical protein